MMTACREPFTHEGRCLLCGAEADEHPVFGFSIAAAIIAALAAWLAVLGVGYVTLRLLRVIP